MRLKIRKMASSIAFYLFILFVIVNLPQAIYGSAEFERRAIFTSLGVDKVNDGYEVSGLMLIEATPETISSNTQLVTATGRDFSEALYRLSIELGKEIGFAHCDTFIVSDSLKDEDIAKVLDFSIRGSRLTQNSKLITCKGSAKDVLQVNMDKKDQIGTSLARSITNSSDYLAISDIDLKEFFNSYYSKSGISWTTVVETVEEESESSSSSESGSSGSNQESKPKKKIKSEGQVAVYKKGKLQYIVEDDFANVINILNPYTQMGYIYLENIPDGDRMIEKISIQILEKSTKRNYYFDNGVACCDINLKMYLNVLSLKTDEINVEEIDESKTHINDNIKAAIIKYMEDNTYAYNEHCKQYKIDFFNTINLLYRVKNQEFKKYITDQEIANGFIENTRFKLNVEIESKL